MVLNNLPYWPGYLLQILMKYKRGKSIQKQKNNDISWRIRSWIRWHGFHQHDWSARSNLGTVFFLISSRFIPFSAFGITFENVVEKVNQTCERCPLDNSQCSEQTAPPSIFFQEEKEELMNRTFKKLVTDYRAKNLRIWNSSQRGK